MLEVQASRGNIRTDEETCLLLIESKEVSFPVPMVHISMKLVHMAVEHNLWFIFYIILFELYSAIATLVMPASFVYAFVPVKFLDYCCEQVYRLTVACEHNHFLVLVAVKECQ